MQCNIRHGGRTNNNGKRMTTPKVLSDIYNV